MRKAVWRPFFCLTTTTSTQDFAPAARNACEFIWGQIDLGESGCEEEGGLVWAMCNIHVSGRWFDSHKPHNPENLKFMTIDFEELKNCASLDLIKSLVPFDRMIHKWTYV